MIDERPPSDLLAPSANDWGHRPHLDGLRAIAVYLVVLFHAGSFRFRGGFIGVDLFFVLSGFLVTNVMLTDLATHGRLRLARFYARRARRLIPAAALAVVGTSLGALLISNPLDRLALVSDSRAASLWYANWHFIREADDYFAAGDAESPFLHFWSLAIEEQFYVVFPLVLVGLAAATRRRLGQMMVVVAALVAVGVVAQLYWARSDPNRAYLGTDARAYQLLVGVLLALVIWRFRLPSKWASAAAVLFAISVAGFVALAMTGAELSASRRGLLAALVAGSIILTGELGRNGPLANALGWRPVRYLGGISYGTYLWHWPVVVLADRVVDLTPFATFVLSAVLGTALAALSHALVEDSVRRSAWLDRRATSVVFGGIAVAAVSGLLIAPTLLRDGRAASISAPQSRAGVTPTPGLDWEAVKDDLPGVPRCAEDDGSDCRVVAGDGPTIFLFGDSHVRMLLPAVEIIAEERGGALYVSETGSCPWPETAYLGDVGSPRTDTCIERRARTYDSQLEAIDPDIVIVASRGRRPDSGLQPRSSDSAIVAASPAAVLEMLVPRSVDALTAGGRQVLLVEPVVEVLVDPLDCLSGAEFQEQCVLDAVTQTSEEAIYRRVAADRSDVVSLDLDEIVCPGVRLCPPIIDGVVVRRDDNHVTATFAATLAPVFDAAMVDAGWLDPIR